MYYIHLIIKFEIDSLCADQTPHQFLVVLPASVNSKIYGMINSSKSIYRAQSPPFLKLGNLFKHLSHFSHVNPFEFLTLLRGSKSFEHAQLWG